MSEQINNPLHGIKLEDIINDLLSYDIIIMIDCLEHLDKDIGKEVVKKLYDKANKAIIFSYPGNYQPRKETPWDNKLELHKCLWTDDEIAEIIGPVNHHKSTICCKLKV